MLNVRFDPTRVLVCEYTFSVLVNGILDFVLVPLREDSSKCSQIGDLSLCGI